MPLTIGHLNARSLVPSVKEVNAILHAYSIDVFCIGETWLSRNTTPEQLQFPGYQLIRNDRCGRIRGGVCILFRNDVTKVNTLKTTLPSSALETLWVTISAPFITAAEVVVGVIYRPSGSGTVDTTEDLRSQLNDIMSTDKPLYVLGDTNFDLLKANKPGVGRYKAMLDDLQLKQLVASCTRPVSGTLLDHVLVRCKDNVTVARVEPCNVSDHHLVIAETDV